MRALLPHAKVSSVASQRSWNEANVDWLTRGPHCSELTQRDSLRFDVQAGAYAFACYVKMKKL